MIVSIVIGVDDVPSFKKDEGRIVAVKPSGWQWGTEEVKQFLIVEMDLGSDIDTIEDAQKLTVPEFDTGDIWWPSAVDKDGYPAEQPKILSKRRYSIPLSDVVAKAGSLGMTIDINKIKDMSVEYQPIKTLTIPFQGMVKDKMKNKKLDSTDLVEIKQAGK